MGVVSSYQQHPLLSLLNPLSPSIMQDMKSFMAKHNNGEVPKVYETSTGRMQLIVLDSMTLPKIFGIEKLKLDTVADLDPLWVWVGSPKEAPTQVIYIVGPMSKMKEKVLK
jgi:hypothetical protein